MQHNALLANLCQNQDGVQETGSTLDFLRAALVMFEVARQIKDVF